MMTKRKCWGVYWILLLCLGGSAFLQGYAKDKSHKQDNKELVYYAGLRRSNYGLKKKNQDDLWWSMRAREFAASIPKVTPVKPVIIQIVAGYLSKDGTTKFEFEKPENYIGSTKNMTFRSNGLDHEQALTTYDEQGIKAIIQIEPGNADVLACLDIAQLTFGHHPCIIGYGIDAEWYFAKESKNNTGLPVSDEDVKKWVNKVVSFDPNYTLFLKHWDPAHMPSTYRHPNLWFLSDSQDFQNLEQMMEDFRIWGNRHNNHVVGYQYGYKKDRKWWKKMKRPPVEISQAILRDISNTQFLFWVDFTADAVTFGQEKSR
jgi:hypothetical protein